MSINNNKINKHTRRMTTRNTQQQQQEHRALIVGGQEAPVGKYDAIVWSGDRGGWGCGGSMIAPDVFLTAAHCLFAFEEQGGAYVGAYSLEATTEKASKKVRTEDGGGKFYKVVTMLPHPNHKEPDHDVMLIKLKNANIQNYYQVNHDPDFPQVGDTIGLVGFGLTEEDGELSPVLKEVTVDVFDHELCNSTFYNESGFEIKDEIHLCTGTVEGGRDGCDSDSGTPLLIDNVVVGVTNDGVGCGRPNVPAYNARVSAHANWIEQSLCAISEYPPDHCLQSPFADMDNGHKIAACHEYSSNSMVSMESFIISILIAFVAGIASSWYILQHTGMMTRHHKRSSYFKLTTPDDDDYSLETAATEQPSPALSSFSDKF
jgi:secreted trypsin-like serine protease